MRKTKPQNLMSIYAKCINQGDCKIWDGGLSRNGYPYIHSKAKQAKKGGRRTGGSSVSGRRLVWELKHKEPPSGVVRMTCRNKLCLNPAHMEVVDHKTIGRLAVEAGAYNSTRHVLARLRNGARMAKLTQQAANEIREVAKNFKPGRDPRRPPAFRELAEKFGVSYRCVSAAANGERWAGVKKPVASVWDLAA